MCNIIQLFISRLSLSVFLLLFVFCHLYLFSTFVGNLFKHFVFHALFLFRLCNIESIAKAIERTRQKRFLMWPSTFIYTLCTLYRCVLARCLMLADCENFAKSVTRRPFVLWLHMSTVVLVLFHVPRVSCNFGVMLNGPFLFLTPMKLNAFFFLHKNKQTTKLLLTYRPNAVPGSLFMKWSKRRAIMNHHHMRECICASGHCFGNGITTLHNRNEQIDDENKRLEVAYRQHNWLQ